MTPASERTAVFPHHHVPVYREDGPLWLHAVELFACVGLGQRGVIVGPPRSGLTTLLREIGTSLMANHPPLETWVLAIDRPAEDLMEWRADLPGVHLHGTTSEDDPHAHVAIDHVFEDAAAHADRGGDALVLVDSLAALARAYNATVEASDRVLSGGLLAPALMEVRKRFGLARAWEEGGSLTVLATVSHGTAVEADEIVHQELVGTGNMDIVLDRPVREAGIFPPLDLERTGTRAEHRIVGEQLADARAALRGTVMQHGNASGMQLLLHELERAGGLDALLASWKP